MNQTNQLQISDDEQGWVEMEKFLLTIPKTKLLNLRDNIESLPEANSETWTRFTYDHPIEFAEKVLNIWQYLHPHTRKRIKELGIPWYTEDQKRFFDSVVANKRTLALSGNAVGKTFCMAIIALWLYHKGYMVITTAPTLEQLQDALWGQMRDFRKHSKPGMGGHWLDVKTRASFGPKHFMTGFTVRTESGDKVATPFQGRHGALIAILADEIVGIPYGIIEAADVVCVNDNAKIVGAGNPHDKNAPIRGVSEIPGLWNIVQISCENHPNYVYNEEIIPGATTRRMVQDQLDKCGGNRDASLFRSTVLGLWPGNDEDSLIDEVWIERAMKRGAKERDEDYRGKALGVDIAGEGGDLSGGVIWDKSKIKFPKTSTGKCWIRGQGIQESVNLVHDIMQKEPDIRVIGIDATGVGDGPASQLMKERNRFPTYSLISKKTLTIQEDIMQRASIVSIKFSHKPDNELAAERFERVRDQMWWELREALRKDEIDLPTEEELRAAGFPPDSDLKEQLKRPIFFQNARGAIIVLDRKGVGGITEEVRARARNLPSKSPDVAHMILLALKASKHLKPGEKPIRTIADVRAAEFQMIKNKERQQKDAKKNRSRFSAPWMRRR